MALIATYRRLVAAVAAARRLRRDDAGTSLLEMTIVTPFLLALGLGVVEFSNALYQYHLVTSGVRDAGRYLAGVGDINGDGVPDRDATVRSNAKKIAVYGSLDGTVKRVSWWDTSDINVRYCIQGVQEGDATPDCPCDNTLGLRGGSNKVCVATTATYDDVGLLDYFGLGPLTISTDHEERYFGTR